MITLPDNPLAAAWFSAAALGTGALCLFTEGDTALEKAVGWALLGIALALAAIGYSHLPK
jgi:hypothetical protein